MESQSQVPKSLKIILSILVAIVIICLLAMGAMWSKLNSFQAKVPIDPEVELQELVSEIEVFLTLPKDEKPTLITLTDEELNAVKGEVFFANAIPGDKLIIYQNNSKAVIWRPSARKVVEASIINLTAPAAQ
jgi:hypothetical protein